MRCEYHNFDSDCPWCEQQMNQGVVINAEGRIVSSTFMESKALFDGEAMQCGDCGRVVKLAKVKVKVVAVNCGQCPISREEFYAQE